MMRDEISLRDLLLTLRRRIWWVLVPLVLAIGAAVGALYWITPVYRTSTTLIVTNLGGGRMDYDTLLFNRNLAKTYIEVARSRSVVQEAIRRLNLTEDVDALLGRISATTVRDTEVISIAVSDTDPKQAAAIANTVATIFGEQYRAFTSLDNLRLLDAAPVPDSPVRPRPLLYLALGAAGGLASGFALAFLVEALNPKRGVEVREPDPRPEPEPGD